MLCIDALMDKKNKNKNKNKKQIKQIIYLL